MNQKSVFVGLGSNLGDGPRQIASALRLLSPAAAITGISRLYTSPPWGRSQQPAFTNAVARLTTALSPLQLLHAMQDIEHTLGRRRTGRRWGPRPIDMDLLLFGSDVIELPGLTVPHPWMHRRAFVLIPLLELEADIQIPALGSGADCLQKLDQSEVSAIRPLADHQHIDLNNIVSLSRSDEDE